MKMNSNNLPNDIEQLKTLVLESHKKINDLEKQTEHWQLKYESLLESFKLAQQHRYGASSEKNILQDDLFDEADVPIPLDEGSNAENTVKVVAHEREKRHPKRTHYRNTFHEKRFWWMWRRLKKYVLVVAQKSALVNR